jgi:putative ABC transport system permease protein
VLAFSVSARAREFGIRLALGSEPQRVLKGVIAEGAVMAAIGRPCRRAFGFVLMTVAVIASVVPAARAARVDVMQALRSE